MNWREIGRRVLGAAARPQQGRATAPQPRGGRHVGYAPNLDGAADPGEIVWAWVPYEEDASRGKDRPLLVVGREGENLLGLMLSSNSDREGQRHWLPLGTGT
ncbi:MAG: hypothetical protein QOH84_21, partial [Kribbellaceae bacterium]|nr:hypothetical protein [Kribbellaceae bacterium]